MNQEQIGKFIATLRKEKNFTQEVLAEKLNVNVKSVSRWENGKNLPDPSTMKELCDVLNISMSELFAGEKCKNEKKVGKIIIFYILVGFTGIFILPTLGLIAPTFILCSMIVPILSFIKLITYFFGIDIPIILFQIGNFILNPILAFPVSILISIALYFIGKKSWKLLMNYIHYVSNKKKELYTKL